MDGDGDPGGSDKDPDPRKEGDPVGLLAKSEEESSGACGPVHVYGFGVEWGGRVGVLGLGVKFWK